MIPVTELRKGEIFKENSQPYVVLTYAHVKMGRGNAVIKIKAKNLISGSVVEKTFLSGSSVEAADVEKIRLEYLYKRGASYFFMDRQTYETLDLSQDFLGEAVYYLREGETYFLLKFEGRSLSLELPLNVALKVVEAGSAFKGNSATNVSKVVKLETGLVVNAPGFIEDGNFIKVDTRSGQYVERA